MRKIMRNTSHCRCVDYKLNFSSLQYTFCDTRHNHLFTFSSDTRISFDRRRHQRVEQLTRAFYHMRIAHSNRAQFLWWFSLYCWVAVAKYDDWTDGKIKVSFHEMPSRGSSTERRLHNIEIVDSCVSFLHSAAQMANGWWYRRRHSDEGNVRIR